MIDTLAVAADVVIITAGVVWTARAIPRVVRGLRVMRRLEQERSS